MSAGAPRVAVADLLQVTRELFTALGVPPEAAAEVAEALVRADQEGQPSNGVMMAELYARRLLGGSATTRTQGEVVSDREATAVIDAGHALGQLTARQAVDLACDKAARFGVGIVAVRNANHFGTASRYAERATERGMVGIVMCNTRPLMPAPGGGRRLVGNNPIAIAIPTSSGEPLSFDMATSQAAMGKIRLAAAAGERIPPDWATDERGVATTDPQEAIRGMLLPAAGPKGFGLALMIDLLSGLLSGGGWGDTVTPLFGDMSVPYNCSQLFIAIDPGSFVEPASFAEQAQRAADRVRASPRADPADSTPGRAPGDARRLMREANRETVPVARPVLRNLVSIAKQHGVSVQRLEPLLATSPT